MTQNKSKIDIAIEWIDETIPHSTQFDDTYYSKTDGLSESRHVFIDGNDLKERWANTKQFTIAELGFGTGLNFLATVQAWEQKVASDSMLNYISFEQFPLKSIDFIKALSRWSEMEAKAIKLANELDAIDLSSDQAGVIKWSPNIELTIHFGDANKTLVESEFMADAWYLDGFSPAKNPQLWSLDLMKEVYRHTLDQGSFATYTSAGWVRRNLLSAGFIVERVQGHAGKRQMSIGRKMLSKTV